MNFFNSGRSLKEKLRLFVFSTSPRNNDKLHLFVISARLFVFATSPEISSFRLRPAITKFIVISLRKDDKLWSQKTINSGAKYFAVLISALFIS